MPIRLFKESTILVLRGYQVGNFLKENSYPAFQGTTVSAASPILLFSSFAKVPFSLFFSFLNSGLVVFVRFFNIQPDTDFFIVNYCRISEYQTLAIITQIILLLVN